MQRVVCTMLGDDYVTLFMLGYLSLIDLAHFALVKNAFARLCRFKLDYIKAYIILVAKYDNTSPISVYHLYPRIGDWRHKYTLPAGSFKFQQCHRYDAIYELIERQNGFVFQQAGLNAIQARVIVSDVLERDETIRLMYVYGDYMLVIMTDTIRVYNSSSGIRMYDEFTTLINVIPDELKYTLDDSYVVGYASNSEGLWLEFDGSIWIFRDVWTECEDWLDPDEDLLYYLRCIDDHMYLEHPVVKNERLLLSRVPIHQDPSSLVDPDKSEITEHHIFGEDHPVDVSRYLDIVNDFPVEGSHVLFKNEADVILILSDGTVITNAAPLISSTGTCYQTAVFRDDSARVVHV
jgi:hypothetical protein